MATSRERVTAAINHEEPDLVPLDLGGTEVTGMHVDTVYALRQALQLDPPGTPVKLTEPYQFLAEIGDDLRDALGVDTVPLWRTGNIFGFANEGWKQWTTFAGTPVLVPDKFNTEPESSGEIRQYPQGDRTATASARMPKGGFYFDSIIRQDPIDDDNLNLEDNLEEWVPISDLDLAHIATEIERLARTDRAIIGDFGGSSFGDAALVPGMELRHPKGIRAIDEWYMSMNMRSDYVYALFEGQCEVAMQNLAKVHQIVGNRLTGVVVSTTDFGAQNGPLFSPKTYRQLFQPFHRKINDWIHENTTWKTFMHNCGSIWRLLDDVVEAGFDCINPVQTSATDMDPEALKAKYGDRLTFWGGGIDTQKVLPFGTPDDVRAMVRERIRIFGSGGGFVYAPIHNVQAGVPIENLLAMYEAVAKYRDRAVL